MLAISVQKLVIQTNSGCCVA